MDKWIDLEWERPVYEEGMTPFEMRELYHQNEVKHKVTIMMVTWNNVEKTKLSVKYLLEHTSHIPFKLVFFDNASTDDTLEFLKTVDYPDKTIIASKHNIGLCAAVTYVYDLLGDEDKSEYVVQISNDCIVTEGWLDNFLTCMGSDLQIGAVSGATTNDNPCTDPEITYSSIEELQEIGKIFNKSDEKKWFSCNIISTIIMMMRSSTIKKIGIYDSYFNHYAADNDLNKRLLYNGYKQVVCFDTLIHHNQLPTPSTQASSDIYWAGERQFTTIYPGKSTSELKETQKKLLSMGHFTQKGEIKALGINVDVGSPLYWLAYQYQLEGNKEVGLSGYTTKAKYYQDLQYVCPNGVACDRIMYLSEHYEKEQFHCIVLGEAINGFPDPVALFQVLLSLLKPKGQVFFKGKNYRGYEYYRNRIEGRDVAWMEGKMQLPQLVDYLDAQPCALTTQPDINHKEEEKRKNWWAQYGDPQMVAEEDKEDFFLPQILFYYEKP